ncbi:MAG: dTDP-4-dehydrorhamnose 3,5-epimerase family protein [Candidatus Dormibacteria bacterium]
MSSWQRPTAEMEVALGRMAATAPSDRLGPIEGVMVKSLVVHADQRGLFTEQLRRGDLDDAGLPFVPEHGFAQMSRSLAFARGGNPPELIKAFHWHRLQWDYWDFVQGDVRVVLVDLRPGSKTCGRTQVLIAGERQPKVIAIPPLVAHGYQVLSLRDVLLCYYVTEPYRAEDPDEGRIPWNDPRIGFDWSVDNI